MYMPQGQTPPCLFYLMPPIFCIELCTAAKLKREETELPVSYSTRAKGSPPPGRWEMSIPNSFGPETSSPTCRGSTLCIGQRCKKMPSTHLFSELCCQSVKHGEWCLPQAVLKHLALPSFPKHVAAQHRITDSLCEGVPLLAKCLRTNSRSAD